MMMAVINTVAIVLAVRFIVLVAVIGGVALTYMALGNPDPYRLGALAIYSMAIVGPTIWLAARK
jgi:hypothetical protein